MHHYTSKRVSPFSSFLYFSSPSFSSPCSSSSPSSSSSSSSFVFGLAQAQLSFVLLFLGLAQAQLGFALLFFGLAQAQLRFVLCLVQAQDLPSVGLALVGLCLALAQAVG